MMRSLTRCVLPVAMLWAAGCEPSTGLEDVEPCPQLAEVPNHGCARIVVMVEGPPKPWPELYGWSVYAVSVRRGRDFVFGSASHVEAGVVQLLLIRNEPPTPGLEDSASVWVHARMLAHPPEPEPPSEFAADSVLHVARFAPTGERPRVGRVRLTLQRR
ncbi:MAG TPA: hypothetical protein VHG08_13800 [Longimicrobium sp.]|nr:hypothetical protein [Longimicrobium sp.]